VSRSRLWPVLSVLLAAGAAAVVFAEVDFPLRPVLVLAFLLVCPGMALVRHLRIGDGVTELTLAVALSFALIAIVPGAMLYAGAWSPRLALLVLIGITLTAALVDIARLRRERVGGTTP
jgi:uncharacterized membrane protein